MSNVNPKVAAMVERALKKNPELRSAELQERAIKLDKSVRNLTGRQFHARYALQARKRLFGGKRSGLGKSGTGTPRVRRDDTDPVVTLLTESYREKKDALDAAIDEAFRQALRADSFRRVNTLLSSIERETRQFEDA